MKCIWTFLLLLFVSGRLFAQVDNALLLDYIQNQKYKEAAQYLKGIYAEPITDDKALQNLAYTSRMSGNLADAENYYLRLLQKDSTKTAVLFSLGNINLNRQNKQKALVYYKKILALDSTNFSVYKQLGDLTQGDTVNCLMYLQKANSLNPIDADVAYDLSRIYLKKNKPDVLILATNVLDKALKADTANLFLLETKTNVLYLQKRSKETIDACNKLIANGNRAPQVISWMAISYFRLRQYKQCLATFRMVPDEKQSEAIFFYMAECYRALNDNPNAIAYYQKAIKDGISGNVPDYYIDLGDCYANLHQSGKALAAYQRSLTFDDRPLTYYSLANVYDVELKDSKTAIKYFKKYLAAKPNPVEEQKYIDYAKFKLAPPATASTSTSH